VSTEWELPRRAEACAACGRSFEVGETFVACLYSSAGNFERRDFCVNCPSARDPAALARWRTRRPAPAAGVPRSWDRESIFALFQRLADDGRAEARQLRFVLALLLWRKKVLRFERAARGPEGESWRFVARHSDDDFLVLYPDLDEAALERLSLQLDNLLAGAAPEPVGASSNDGGERRDG